MIKLKDPVSVVLLIINIIFLLYYSIQLLIFTDEFALKNIGFYNHAVAGLSEIIGIIFLCLAIGLFISFFNGAKNQAPLFITILLSQMIISFNFWRYVFTNSPGETDIKTITFNASVFLLFGFLMLLLILRLKNVLKYKGDKI